MKKPRRNHEETAGNICTALCCVFARPARKPAGRMVGRGLRLISREVAMKKTIVSAFLFAVACTAGLAQAQTAAPASQEFQYPSVRSDGSLAAPRRCASPSRARPGAGAGGDRRYPGQQVRVRTLPPGGPRRSVQRADADRRGAMPARAGTAPPAAIAGRPGRRAAPRRTRAGRAGAIRRGQGTLVRRFAPKPLNSMISSACGVDFGTSIHRGLEPPRPARAAVARGRQAHPAVGHLLP